MTWKLNRKSLRNLEMMRISAAALCRIEVGNGRLLLGLNKNRKEAGFEILTPLGGASSVRSRQAKAAVESFGAVWEEPTADFPEVAIDLRLKLPRLAISAFEVWLIEYQADDADARRELREEMVHEYKALAAILFGDIFDHALYRRWTQHVSEEATSRSGLEGVMTRRYSVIFDVQYDERWTGTLIELCDTHSDLELVTSGEILSGWSASGRRISSISASLLLA